MPSPARAVITGGPGAGKSALLEDLGRRGIAVEEEVARAILKDPGGMALRANDPAEFARAMFDAELEAWQAVEDRAGPTVFDRGFPDIVGFLRLEGLAVPADIAQACHDLRYDGPVFRAPPWQAIYRPDAERIQDWEAAVASDASVCAAWREYGYSLVDLPFASVPERAAYILDMLRNG